MNPATSLARVSVLSLGLALLLSACGGATDGSSIAPDAGFQGVDGVISDTSDTTRIVTLSGDLTEFVYALGSGESIVATDLTTVYPESAVMLPKVGVGRFLSAEAVLQHRPSLVIADTQTAPQSAIDQLRDAGVPVIVLSVSTSFDAMYDKIGAIGAILHVEREAGSLASRMETEIGIASQITRVEGDPARIAYLYTRGPDVMLLFGDEMVTRPVIEAAGGVDAGSASGITGSIPVTPEALVVAAPDVIIVPIEGLEVLGGIEGLLSIPGISATPAGASRRILAYPEGDFLTLGPRIPVSVALLASDLGLVDSPP